MKSLKAAVILLILWAAMTPGVSAGAIGEAAIAYGEKTTIDISMVDASWQSLIRQWKDAPAGSAYRVNIPPSQTTIPREVIHVMYLRKISAEFVEPSGYSYTLYGEDLRLSDITRSRYTYKQLENLAYISAQNRDARLKSEKKQTPTSRLMPAPKSPPVPALTPLTPAPVAPAPKPPAASAPTTSAPTSSASASSGAASLPDLTSSSQGSVSAPAPSASAQEAAPVAAPSEPALAAASQTPALRPLSLADVAFVFLTIGALIPLGIGIIIYLLLPKKSRP